MPRLRRLTTATLVAGVALLGAACEGDDDAAVSEPDVGGDVSDVDGPGSDEDPFTEECTLAVTEIENLLDPPDDYLEKEVTATPGEFDGSTCEWSSSYAMELMVTVNAYDDYFHDESTGKPIPGLADESWFNTKVSSLYWRRDGYAVSLHTGITTEFTEQQLVDLAHAIDDDLPAE